jgi:hypothetical protein
VNFCPLCHRDLGTGTARAFVPVSPVVYPGVEGLEVHGDCLAAARRGEFDVPLPRGPVSTLVATVAVLLLVTITIIVALF